MCGGERPEVAVNTFVVVLFQSTLPVGGATTYGLVDAVVGAISIHAPRGGSDRMTPQTYRMVLISIHAPRGGSDHMQRRVLY